MNDNSDTLESIAIRLFPREVADRDHCVFLWRFSGLIFNVTSDSRIRRGEARAVVMWLASDGSLPRIVEYRFYAH